jgi:molecular chaperone DnaJ
VCEIAIDFAQAALGHSMEMPTLRGSAPLQVPAGTQTGEVFRLKGEGAPGRHESGHGDQLVRIRIVTPQNLTEKQRKLFGKLAQTLEESDKEA